MAWCIVKKHKDNSALTLHTGVEFSKDVSHNFSAHPCLIITEIASTTGMGGIFSLRKAAGLFTFADQNWAFFSTSCIHKESNRTVFLL